MALLADDARARSMQRHPQSLEEVREDDAQLAVHAVASEPVPLSGADWPSLDEAAFAGWRFCGELSGDDASEEASWLVVSTGAASPKAAATCNPPLAQKLSASEPSGPKPPRAGTRLWRSRASLPPRGEAVEEDSPGPAAEDDESAGDLWDPSCHGSRVPHGWKKQHKASWNTKLQRKVAQQSARRLDQRSLSRSLAAAEHC